MTDTPRLPDGRWAPGTSGNPAGRPASTARQLLEQALAEKDATTGRTALEEIIQAAVGAAREGDVQAAALILDRVIAKLPKPPVESIAGGASLMDVFKRWPLWLQSAAISYLESKADPIAAFPTSLQRPIRDAFLRIGEGTSPAAAGLGIAFSLALSEELDEATRIRLRRAAFDGVELGETPEGDLEKCLAELPPEDQEHLDRIIAALREKALRMRRDSAPVGTGSALETAR